MRKHLVKQPKINHFFSGMCKDSNYFFINSTSTAYSDAWLQSCSKILQLPLNNALQTLSVESLDKQEVISKPAIFFSKRLIHVKCTLRTMLLHTKILFCVHQFLYHYSQKKYLVRTNNFVIVHQNCHYCALMQKSFSFFAQ